MFTPFAMYSHRTGLMTFKGELNPENKMA